MAAHHRTQPNIVITGTPGTGKTTHCAAIADRTGLRHLAVNDIVRDHNPPVHDGFDDTFQSWLVDEDRLLDALEDDEHVPSPGGNLIDWHACDLFPVSWVDLVVVLTADTNSLYDRLVERKYPEVKLQENIDAEIMQVLLNEAQEAYDPEIVIPLQSNSVEDMETNIDRVVAWVEQWRKDNAGGKTTGESKDEEEAEN